MAAEFGSVPGSVLLEDIAPDSLRVTFQADQLDLPPVSENINLSQIRPTSIVEQGKVISSSPGLEVVELPIERYMFGEFDMTNEKHRIAFEEYAPSDVVAEYRKHLRDKDKGIVNKQIIWRHTYPSWDASLAKPNEETAIIDLESRRDLPEEGPQDLERVA